MLSNENIQKWKALSDLFLGWISIVGALCGGAYAIAQYIENSEAERVKETLKFIEIFNSQENIVSKRRIDIFLAEKDSEISKKYEEGELAYKEYLKANITKEDLIYFNNIFDFYDQLYICATSDLCDRKISIKLFGKYAYDVAGTFYPLIDDKIKNGDILFGEGILYFFKEYKVIFSNNKAQQGV